MVVDLEALRAHVGTGPSDPDLEAALAAALEALDNRYGPDVEEVTEYLRPFRQWVKLSRRASEVSSVIEGTTAREETDFALWPDEGSRYVRRVADDKPRSWTDNVEVTYTPLSEAAERDRVVFALCDLELARHFGLRSITVGPWSETYPDAADDGNYTATRDMILDSLRPPAVGIW